MILFPLQTRYLTKMLKLSSLPRGLSWTPFNILSPKVNSLRKKGQVFGIQKEKKVAIVHILSDCQWLHSIGWQITQKNIILRAILITKLPVKPDVKFVDLLKLEEESSGSKGPKACIRESPLLFQCHLFKEGYDIKGTLLVNKKLKPRTIQVRPLMIKVEKDSRLTDSDSFSSLEIVSISRRPRKANLSKNLIALLSVGGVPKEYFLGLLETTLQEAQKVSSTIIGSRIPFDEVSYSPLKEDQLNDDNADNGCLFVTFQDIKKIRSNVNKIKQ